MTAPQLPEPLVPPEVDLTGYEYMPLHWERLFKSETWIGAKPEHKVAMLKIWCHAFGAEIPASSLPQNDHLLADYAGFGAMVAAWKRARAVVLRGFVECSDGRLYHPFVAKVAMTSWKARLADRMRGVKARMGSTEKKINEPKESANKAQWERLLQEQRQELLQLTEWSVTANVWRLSQTTKRSEVKGSEVILKPPSLRDVSGSPPDDPPLELTSDPPKRVNGARYYADAEDVLGYLNRRAGKGFEFRSRAGDLTTNAERIIARLKQGYTREELREVVHAKCEQWRNDEKMAEYLRPATLFAKENFEQYLGELKGGNG